jgi:EAL domain-containing protein (putative c-di-GMP-specific phosphodiesterase class I)
LLSHADAAVFRAKGLGKNRCHLFSTEDQDIQNVHSRLKQKERILKALEEDRFEPWFQPILDLSDRQIHHYEALARMRDEEGNIVLPGAFISIAEALGFIDAIDQRITAKTIVRQAELQRQGIDLSFAMNISGKNLGDEQLLEYLRHTIHESGATPAKLVFEITETAAIQDLRQAIMFINALKAMGCQFALDDFGVGFTSFVYLREMAVDFVKIDGAFIRRLHEHNSDQGIVKAITMIAGTMGIRTIAEFVEKDETLHLLEQFGVDYAQGFLIGKPEPLSYP